MLIRLTCTKESNIFFFFLKFGLKISFVLFDLVFVMLFFEGMLDSQFDLKICNQSTRQTK